MPSTIERPPPTIRRQTNYEWKFLEPEGIYHVGASLPSARYPDYHPRIWIWFIEWNPDAGRYRTGRPIARLELTDTDPASVERVRDLWTRFVCSWHDPVERDRLISMLQVLPVL